MAFTSHYISYQETGKFSALVLDYIKGTPSLQPFYNFEVNKEGIKNAIAERKNFPVSRRTLQEVILEDYEGIALSSKLKENISALSEENCFTICTAHQPNIFTGHLYFIYKILHAIKLAEELSTEFPANKFVPVYYMGSEDADLDELGEVTINQSHYQWVTKQTGAVGRMKIDDNLTTIIHSIEAEIGILPFAGEILSAVKKFYIKGETIEQATFGFVHYLFSSFGLVILKPDNASLKAGFLPVTIKELKTSFSAHAVEETIKSFPEKYKIQAAGREVNLFYLKNDKRERIEKLKDGFFIEGFHDHISVDDLIKEFTEDPSLISPNVILRPVMQEMMLPNIAFIGGGGELAYWLELKNVFAEANVFFPMLVLRNSFTIIPGNLQELQQKLNLSDLDIFRPVLELEKQLVLQNSTNQLTLEEEKKELEDIYSRIEKIATATDPTLSKHVRALEHKAKDRLIKLETKLVNRARSKAEADSRQIDRLKSGLFPTGNLQERVDNILTWYAQYGPELIQEIYTASNSLNPKFCILKAE